MSRKIQMADVVRAHIEVRGCPVLTGNQCHAIAMNLNCQIGSTPAYDEAKELAECRSQWEKNPNCLFYDMWTGWKACAQYRARSAE